MASAQAPPRYPKRKRDKISYKYGDESSELGEDVDHAVPPIQDDPDDEVDWKTSRKKVSSTWQSDAGICLKLTIVLSRLASPRLARDKSARLPRKPSSP